MTSSASACDVGAGVDEPLAVQPDRRADLVGQRRLDTARLVAGEDVELDALAGGVDVLDLLEQGAPLVGGAVGGEERRRLDGLGARRRRRRSRSKALQRQPVDRDQPPIALPPVAGGAVPGEAGEEAERPTGSALGGT